MNRILAIKINFCAAIFVLAAIFLTACTDQNQAAAGPAQPSSSSSLLAQANDADPDAASSELYLGQDWDEPRMAAAPPRTIKPGSSKPAPPTAPPSKPAEGSTSNGYWTLVLGTFSNVGHEDAAKQMLANLPAVAPQLTGARVHTSTRGSMVIYGTYTTREDPRAQTDQDRIKAITFQNRPVFNRVLLTYIDLRLTQGQLHPHDLLNARRENPKVDPLYTLDIAIWMANDEKSAGRDRLTFAQVKQKAEAYAAELRARREQAYFYHDEANQQSVVTVGLFDRRAIHPVSQLYSDEVEALIKRFPVRLANGEPLQEFINRRIPKAGTRPQVPKLVLVPSM